MQVETTYLPDNEISVFATEHRHLCFNQLLQLAHYLIVWDVNEKRASGRFKNPAEESDPSSFCTTFVFPPEE